MGDPWLCICGETNTSPACSNCGQSFAASTHQEQLQESDALIAQGRGNMLGILTTNSRSAAIPGCQIMIWIIIIGILGSWLVPVVLGFFRT